MNTETSEAKAQNGENAAGTVVTDPLRQRLILFSICFASFMVNLDTYIVNISLPNIAHCFNAAPSTVSWVVLSYNLTVASLLIIIGRIGDRIGLKKVFTLGFALFTLSSLICGIAHHMLVLILGRCIQGIGASMLYAMTPAMVPKFLPPRMRGPAFGTLATAAALGITVGTPLGGIITGYFSWPWIFFINIPVGIIAIAVCERIIPGESKESLMKKESGFDVPGALLSFVCSLSFMYGVSMGKEAGWTSHQITGSFIIAALSLYAFIYWEGKAAYPLLDLSLFRNMEFTYGNMAGGLAFAYLAGNNFLMPFYLMLVKGMKAQQAGMMFMIYSVLYMIIGPLAGKTTNRISPRLLCSAAMALCSLNALVLAGAIRLDTIVLVVLYFIFMAFSFGVFCTSNNTVVMGMAPAGKQGIVSGTYRMVNRLGMAIGVCFFETAFTLFTSSTGSHVTGNYASLPREILIKGFQGAYVAGSIVCMLAFLTSMLARAREKGKAD